VTDRPSYDDPQTYARLAGFAGDWRDTWWNADFLDLLARRFELDRRSSVLDVGCGAGHWGRAVLARMDTQASLVGVDHQPAFFDAARKTARTRGLRATYRAGDAQHLPFEDNSFDVVTCQTVLIHVPDPSAAVAEMLRVAKPGGLVLLVEPDNLLMASTFIGTSVPCSTDDQLALMQLQARCLAGKKALSEGDGTVGAHLPALLHEHAATGVQVFASDKCAWAMPPYDAQAIDMKTQLDFASADHWMPTGPREDSRRHFLAGGGDAEQFDTCWAVVVRWLRAFEQQLTAGTFSAARPTGMVVAAAQPGPGT
jgi:SAM-dependent methyltransferase